MKPFVFDKSPQNSQLRVYFILLALLAVGMVVNASLVQAADLRQQPTVDIPTVTGTPKGAMAVVYSEPEDQINVRSGPGVNYPKVGVLINREEVPAIGKSAGGSWVKIIYVGVKEGVAWVYAPLVRVIGDLPIVAPPPTPTPRTTPTIDPTLASQFVVDIPPTRKPTYTPPPPLVIPTYPVQGDSAGVGGLPMGFLIVGLAVFGLLGIVISFLREL